MRKYGYVCGITVFASVTIGLICWKGMVAQSEAPRMLPANVGMNGGDSKISPIQPVGGSPSTPVTRDMSPKTASTTAPLDRFKKITELPEETKSLVFGFHRGLAWLGRDEIHQPSGRFITNLNPALWDYSQDDHLIRQAIGAVALSRSARLTGEEKYAVRAAQTILSLLTETVQKEGMRYTATSNLVCSQFGASALLAIAILELPKVDEARQKNALELCAFLAKHLNKDGTWTFPEDAPAESEKQFAGLGLYALTLGAARQANLVPVETLQKAMAVQKKNFKGDAPIYSIAWLATAATELFARTKDPISCEFVFELAEWSRKLQYTRQGGLGLNQANWHGGFMGFQDGKSVATAPTIESAGHALILAECCRACRYTTPADVNRYHAIRLPLLNSGEFLVGLQYTQEGVTHFVPQCRPALIGGFRSTLTDGNLRLESTAYAVLALGRLLECAAD